MQNKLFKKSSVERFSSPEKLNDYMDRWYSKFSDMEVALAKLDSKSSAISNMLGM